MFGWAVTELKFVLINLVVVRCVAPATHMFIMSYLHWAFNPVYVFRGWSNIVAIKPDNISLLKFF